VPAVPPANAAAPAAAVAPQDAALPGPAAPPAAVSQSERRRCARATATHSGARHPWVCVGIFGGRQGRQGHCHERCHPRRRQTGRMVHAAAVHGGSNSGGVLKSALSPSADGGGSGGWLRHAAALPGAAAGNATPAPP